MEVLTSTSYGSASLEFRRAFLFLLIFSLFSFFAGRFGVAEGRGRVLWHPSLRSPFVGRVRVKTPAFVGVYGSADDPHFFFGSVTHDTSDFQSLGYLVLRRFSS